MNPGAFIVAAIIWYAGLEFLIAKTRATSGKPTAGSFWLGLAQSMGAFGLALTAAIVFFYRKSH